MMISLAPNVGTCLRYWYSNPYRIGIQIDMVREANLMMAEVRLSDLAPDAFSSAILSASSFRRIEAACQHTETPKFIIRSIIICLLVKDHRWQANHVLPNEPKRKIPGIIQNRQDHSSQALRFSSPDVW